MLVSCEKVITEIKHVLIRQPAPIVVAIDGGSGSGKSTLASAIADELGAALVPLDDFFSAEIPDSEWDLFTLEERLARVFDWNRVREQAIVALLEGRGARWHAFDFESGLCADGTYGMRDEDSEREPADVILIEGAYAAGPELAGLVDVAVLVDVPVEERHRRLEARESRVFLDDWHKRWDAVETYYFTRVRPASSFDLVVRPDVC